MTFPYCGIYPIDFAEDLSREELKDCQGKALIFICAVRPFSPSDYSAVELLMRLFPGGSAKVIGRVSLLPLTAALPSGMGVAVLNRLRVRYGAVNGVDIALPSFNGISLCRRFTRQSKLVTTGTMKGCCRLVLNDGKKAALSVS